MKSQFGSIGNKSKELAIAELPSHIDLNMQENLYISLISFDNKHASDRLSWDLTLEELSYLELEKPYIHNKYISFIQSSSTTLASVSVPLVLERLSPGIVSWDIPVENFFE